MTTAEAHIAYGPPAAKTRSSEPEIIWATEDSTRKIFAIVDSSGRFKIVFRNNRNLKTKPLSKERLQAFLEKYPAPDSFWDEPA